MRNTVKSARAAVKFLGPNRVSLTTDNGDYSEVGFANALIAVGTRPHRPADVPFDRKRIFDSDEMLELHHLPRTLTVIGAGVIGVEYATIFSALDVPVTLAMEVGRTRISIRNLLQLNQGSVVELDRAAGEPLDVFVNGTLVAHGEVVVINEKFGIRLTDVISPAERVRKLR